ncbi:MAG: hypothetical protein IKL29_01150 [Bacteroidaceae bacterium]|nr:hypothetical protein [Bacteroidaceae bacterium]
MTLPLQQLISNKKCRCAEPSAVMVVSTFSPPPSIRRQLVVINALSVCSRALLCILAVPFGAAFFGLIPI